ncbi:M23 family metallopeptidase [Owenweeksia hongkongensis]|uniref:M23 family metallopeptidase n=1 Tax=Owenweeksia hongkongensis TaxID=253245 RepID=UPI003A9194A6
MTKIWNFPHKDYMKQRSPLAFFALFLFSFLANAQDYPQDEFISPLEMPLFLSGTFGELRTNHFHAGIDIKTGGREGQRVLAVADGFVSRIKVSPYGYGNALYIVHPNGYTSVYGHLQRFNDTIQAFIREEQKRQKSFEVELFPLAKVFPVKQGDLVALSGNSGGSGGPHLHFEIRDTRTEKIINPLLFGFDVKDGRSPDIYNLEVYEFDKEELVSSYTRSLLRQGDGMYSLTGSSLIEVSNPASFGITTTDRLDGVPNKNGVYSIRMIIGEEVYYHFVAETFAFAETRYINSHIDFAQKACCRRTINKMYLEPNNQFSAYRVKEHMKLTDLVADSIYPVNIEVSDRAGNVSTLNFELKYSPPEVELAEAPEPDLPRFNYAQTNFFKKDNFQVVLPEGALYSDIYVQYEKKAACSECLSFIHEIATREVPVQKYYTLKIKPDAEYHGDKSKLFIASFKDGKLDDYEGGRWENGFVVARTRQFGEFAVMVDTVPPSVSPVNFRDGSNVHGASRLSFIISDKLSGIDDYSVTIDGEWVLFEYDAKNRLIYTDVRALNLEEGERVLRISVSDDKGNVTEKTYHLIF